MALGSTGAAAAAPMVETLMHAAIRTAAQGVFFSIVINLTQKNPRPLFRHRPLRRAPRIEGIRPAPPCGLKSAGMSAGRD